MRNSVHFEATLQLRGQPDFLLLRAIGLDVHGTLVARTRAHDLDVVRLFRRDIAQPAKRAGVRVVMVSAMPSREGEEVARLLDLRGHPALYELGHFYTPRLLEEPPRLSPLVSVEALEALHELKGLLLRRAHDLASMRVQLEPKVLLVSLNVRETPSAEIERLVEGIDGHIMRWRLPLQIHRSDATIDIGALGVSKAAAFHRLLEEVAHAPGRVAVCGDSRNDIDLLELGTTGMVGCPSNADERVKRLVRDRHGVISRYPYLHGTLDALLRMLVAKPAREEAAPSMAAGARVSVPMAT
jgi:hydroxymethylpyrimidine pyrophosphatase-like HAD family hydrolase